MTTFQFEALPSVTGTTQVSIEVCDVSICTVVSNKLPVEGGIDITGTIGPPIDVSAECQDPGDCDDGNPCTDDDCMTNACSNVPDDSNDPNDDQFCNGLEVDCDAGVIVIQPGSIPDCEDGLPCTDDSCDEVNDVCINDPIPSSCAIGGACFAEGTLNPGNDCEWCASAVNATGLDTSNHGIAMWKPTEHRLRPG